MPGPPEEDATRRLCDDVAGILDGLEPRADRLLVAVSGGPDSAALLHACTRLHDRAGAIFAAHVNHHLREGDSDADERWVRTFCEDLGVDLSVLDGTLDGDAVRHRGVEAAAREVRYRLLAAERTRLHADYVATAHTRSDQAETVLLRLLTGRGAWRLSGIRPVTEDRVVRPLLGVSRAEVMRYVADNRIDPRHDASNDESRFFRNRIRNELLPMILAWNPRIEETLADTAAMELDREAAFAQLLSPVRHDLVSEDGPVTSIRAPDSALPHIISTLLHEEIRRLDPTTRQVDAATLRAIASLKPGESRVVSRCLRARREGEIIRLETLRARTPGTLYSRSIGPGQSVIVAAAGLEISLTETTGNVALASSDRLHQVIQVSSESASSFEIRNRRPGDRFRPLGMDQDKNLADFLIDRRIPREERDSLPLLLCNGSIAWVVGVEVGDDFKVSPAPGRRLEIVARRIGGGT